MNLVDIQPVDEGITKYELTFEDDDGSPFAIIRLSKSDVREIVDYYHKNINPG